MEQPKNANAPTKRVRKQPMDKSKKKDGDIETTPGSSIAPPGPCVPPPASPPPSP